MSILKQSTLLSLALCLGSILGALLGSIVSYVYYIYFALTSSGVHLIQFNDAGAVAFEFLVSCIVSVPLALYFGIPAFFVLRHFCLLNVWAICILGLLVGSFIDITNIMAYGFPWDGVLGLLSALISWLLIVRFKLPLSREVSRNNVAAN